MLSYQYQEVHTFKNEIDRKNSNSVSVHNPKQMKLKVSKNVFNWKQQQRDRTQFYQEYSNEQSQMGKTNNETWRR